MVVVEGGMGSIWLTLHLLFFQKYIFCREPLFVTFNIIINFICLQYYLFSSPFFFFFLNFWHFLVAEKLMTLSYNRWSEFTLKRLFNNCKKIWWYWILSSWSIKRWVGVQLVIFIMVNSIYVFKFFNMNIIQK